MKETRHVTPCIKQQTENTNKYIINRGTSSNKGSTEHDSLHTGTASNRGPHSMFLYTEELPQTRVHRVCFFTDRNCLKQGPTEHVSLNRGTSSNNVTYSMFLYTEELPQTGIYRTCFFTQRNFLKRGITEHPNQPHLLNRYQINMGFSHFHGIRDKHICSISNTL